MMYGTSVRLIKQSSSARGVLVDVMWSDHARCTVRKPVHTHPCSGKEYSFKGKTPALRATAAIEGAWKHSVILLRRRAVVGDNDTLLMQNP
jgi:hypothetical protein